LAVICLKTLFEHTPAGRSWSAAKHQQQLQTALSERFSALDASIHSLPGISHCISIQGAAAAEVEVEVEGSVRALAAGMHGVTIFVFYFLYNLYLFLYLYVFFI
jgi:hypothetical protein